MYWKRISFKNSIGELIFDRKRLFCESIDCNGNAVISTVEQLMNCHGSVTISNYLAPKTIPCSFKLVDLDDDPFLRERIVRILNPLVVGTLEVQTETGTYEISCRPTESPSFKRTDVYYIFTWTTDFYADYPLWKKTNVIHEHEMTYIRDIITSKSSIDVPVEITFRSNQTPFMRQSGNNSSAIVVITSGLTENYLKLDTKDYTAVDSSGNDVSYRVYAADNGIGKMTLCPGENILTGNASLEHPITIKWYDLTTGVF